MLVAVAASSVTVSRAWYVTFSLLSSFLSRLLLYLVRAPLSSTYTSLHADTMSNVLQESSCSDGCHATTDEHDEELVELFFNDMFREDPVQFRPENED